MATSSPSVSGSEDAEDAHARAVCSLFTQIARPYDIFNHVFSLGVDVYWRWRLVRGVSPPGAGWTLDLAAGSGDVALALQKRGHRVVALDFCLPMLERARRKGVKVTVCGDALHLPLANASVEAVTLAFGLRNFSDRHHGLTEICRVLKPGGWLHVLEFTQPDPWFRPVYFFHLKNIMPRVAGWLTNRREAYHYLFETIAAFPSALELTKEMIDAGFGTVFCTRHTAGIVAIHRAQRPALCA